MNENYISSYFKSPIGIIEIKSTSIGLSSIIFVEEDLPMEGNTSTFQIEAEKQLNDYFNGNRMDFDLKLDLKGTEFQLKVWNKLLEIPYGQTISYLQLAKRIGNVKSIRAVGGANGRNPLSIIVPCHRVIGNNGDLVGYGGGLWRKEWLLKHENKSFGNQLF